MQFTEQLDKHLNESLIPSVRELQGCGITLALILPYITAINEKAVADNIDLKTSANNLVNDIKEYRELGHLQGTIKRAEERIAALDAFNTQKQQAVTILMNLEMAGFSEKDITELTACVNTWKAQSGKATLGHINAIMGMARN
jgi:alcohol dehydrogenase class IV